MRMGTTMTSQWHFVVVVTCWVLDKGNRRLFERLVFFFFSSLFYASFMGFWLSNISRYLTMVLMIKRLSLTLIVLYIHITSSI
jgi:hypothetical protein